jgi:hypothetical protein
MPKLCNGIVSNNQAVKSRNSRALCEGINYRITVPSGSSNDSPHLSGSDDNTAWVTGWFLANASSGGTIDPNDAPCCAISNTIVPASS